VGAVFCQRCGTANQAGATFCSKCGAALVTSVSPTAATSPRKSHLLRNVVVLVVIVIVVLVALAVVPVPHPFSESITSGLISSASATFSPPSGSAVSGSWSTVSGDTVTLTVTDDSGTTVYTSDSSSGSFSFTANNPPYTFTADKFFGGQTVNVHGTYSIPLI
jgi:zinc-ribbon domain